MDTPVLPKTLPEEFQSPDAYYREITRRNTYFIPEATQEKIRHLRVTIAGCGSTGGACVESLARLGVGNFVLADNGSYELNNLNRQHAGLDNLGVNKAVFHAEELRRINPFAKVSVHSDGVTEKNAAALAEAGDIIVDAVDVTTRSGLKMKLALHEEAHKRRRPVFTAYDIGYCQLGISYDYRDLKVAVLNGGLAAAKQAKHPIKALLRILPLSAIPGHGLSMIHDLLVDENAPAAQLGCTSDLLSAIIVASVVRFVETGTLVKGWNVNLEYLAKPLSSRVKQRLAAPFLRMKIERILRNLE